MVKGIIEKVESKYSYKVRIPIYHKVENTPGAVDTADLPIAPVCTLPGVDPSYKVGDIVWVDFENDEIGMPIIVGVLYRQDIPSSTSDIRCDSIDVSVDTKLPVSTKIGNIGNSLQSLPNLMDRVDHLQENSQSISFLVREENLDITNQELI